MTRGAVRCSAWLGDFIGLGQTHKKEFREQRPDSRWTPERECLESWDSMKARDGAKPKTAVLSRRSELLRVERVDAVAPRWMPSKSAVELGWRLTPG